MSRRADRLAKRAASASRRGRSGDGRGVITYRRVQRLQGLDPAPNPPRLSGLVANGAQAQGATTLLVRGTTLVGRFVAGDRLFVGMAVLTASGNAVAASNAAAIPITAPLPANIADGAEISVQWANDVQISAEITALGKRIPDGRLIQSTDLFLTFAAGLLPWPPSNGDRVFLPGGDIREVVVVTPVLVDGVPISYRLQVR